MKKFPYYAQLDSMDCGPSCLRMIAKFYGKTYSREKLLEKCFVNRHGTSITELSEAAEAIGFRTVMARMPMHQLVDEAPLPAIVHWNSNHYVVVHKTEKHKIHIADPSYGLVACTREEFESHFIKKDDVRGDLGVVLLLEPTPQFFANNDDKSGKWGLPVLLTYLKPYQRLLVQLLLGMMAGGVLQLFFPLMTQSLVDRGIGVQNLNFIHLVLIAQLMLVGSRMLLGLIQNRIFLFMNGRVSISLLSDFLIKLMKLPISFFDSRNTGDIMQRLNDNGRIQAFLTGTTLNLVLSIFNFFFFGLILAWYSMKILAIYLVGSAIHAIWILVFLKRRRELNFKFFENGSSNQNVLIQLIAGMQEIKLHNSERQMRWRWERVQTKAYHLSLKSLNLGQLQETGAFFIHETKNIIITYLTVVSVMNGDMTLGMMMSIQYIIGSLNAPVSAFLSLIQIVQDVKISLERMGEIHQQKNEEDDKMATPSHFTSGPIVLKNVSFRYGSANAREVLRDVSFEIPRRKITAIVGPSGSGKSTLLKLLLRLYDPSDGEIILAGTNISSYSNKFWRSKCAAVMQDGFIFSDTVERNISMSDQSDTDYQKLAHAIKVANIQEYIDSLPVGQNTIIGAEGIGLSQGQRQRILIARAVYKDPDYLFLDEATNALDSHNETSIMSNLHEFFQSRTVVIVAHRLSTVVNADKIIVVNHGTISEQGNHHELVDRGGLYYSLVKNQLELNNN